MEGMRELESNAAEVAAILKAVANERCLMILCKLLELGKPISVCWPRPSTCPSRLCPST